MAEASVMRPAARRLDWLDALRGWAVLGVVAVHSSEVAHSRGVLGTIAGAGQFGVQLFFLVSALTISLTYDSHIRQFGRSLRSQCAWLLKRFFRIAPLYYLAALLYPAEQYSIYRASQHRYGSLTAIPNILANLLFIHTWIPAANNSVVPGGWSIGVEMFFYLLVPFIWMVAPARRRIGVLALAGVFCVASTFAVSQLTTGSTYVINNSYLYYWFPTQAPVIAIGLIFYFLRGSDLHRSTGKLHSVLAFAGFLLLLPVGLWLGSVGKVAPALAPVAIGIAFILLPLCLEHFGRRVVVNRFAIWLGKVSFSVYILHFVVLDGLRTLVQVLHLKRQSELTILPIYLAAVLITCGFASLSKRFIEDPAIAYGHRLSRRVALAEA